MILSFTWSLKIKVLNLAFPISWWSVQTLKSNTEFKAVIPIVNVNIHPYTRSICLFSICNKQTHTTCTQKIESLLDIPYDFWSCAKNIYGVLPVTSRCHNDIIWLWWHTCLQGGTALQLRKFIEDWIMYSKVRTILCVTVRCQNLTPHNG